jgi:hypothetical protein
MSNVLVMMLKNAGVDVGGAQKMALETYERFARLEQKLDAIQVNIAALDKKLDSLLECAQAQEKAA